MGHSTGSEQDRQILYLHGGGYVIGSPSLYRHLTWRLASVARARLLAADYRLAPEHPFPAALDDAMAAYKWMLADGADPRQVAVIGDSAGGGLAFALLLRCRDEGRVPLPAAVGGAVAMDRLALTGASLRRNAVADPFVDANGIPPIAEYYLAGADPRHPYASPLYGDPTGLPPALIQVGSDEVLLDDCDPHSGSLARRGMRGGARNLAADAACVASVRLDDARGPAARLPASARLSVSGHGHDGLARSGAAAEDALKWRQAAQPAVDPQLNNTVPAKTVPALTMPADCRQQCILQPDHKDIMNKVHAIGIELQLSSHARRRAEKRSASASTQKQLQGRRRRNSDRQRSATRSRRGMRFHDQCGQTSHSANEPIASASHIFQCVVSAPSGAKRPRSMP